MFENALLQTDANWNNLLQKAIFKQLQNTQKAAAKCHPSKRYARAYHYGHILSGDASCCSLTSISPQNTPQSPLAAFFRLSSPACSPIITIPSGCVSSSCPPYKQSPTLSQISSYRRYRSSALKCMNRSLGHPSFLKTASSVRHAF